MRTPTTYLRLLAAAASLFLASGMKAQTIEQPIIKVLDGSAGKLKKDSSFSVEDDKWWIPVEKAKLDLSGAYRIKNIISLKLKEDAPVILKPKFSVTVKIKLFITDKDGNIDSSQTPSLTVNYDTLTGATYNTQNLLTFYNAYRLAARIISVDSAYIPTSVSPKPAVTPYVQLENEMQITREYNFSCDILLSYFPDFASYGPIDGDLNVFWDNIPGATEYDFEWVYVDNESASDPTLYRTAGVYDAKKIFRNNATRITTKEYFYNIPMLYPDDGILFFRYRPVQVKPDGQRYEGNWSSDAGGPNYYTDFEGHENDLNWQATTSFAEDGKRKSVVQYYDGSLRSRQTVTKDNTTNTTVVAETMYDYQGRPVIQVLPAPTLSSIIAYSRNFNRRLNSDPVLGYTKELYDTLLNASDYCQTPAPPMGADSSGASMYYSTKNPEATVGFNKFIPDAQYYPFTETRYTQDNTGRILAQSGVGDTFKIGSKHETKYFYGNPDQKELDGLFGTEVGYASHYFKNMVRDANGQYSVTYVDMHGRTIATALAGKVPKSLDTLPSYNTKNITEKLADSTNNITKDLVMESSRSILVTDSVKYVFNYDLNADSLRIMACDSNYICYDCLYNLEISITDECNNCHLHQAGNQPYTRKYENFHLDSIPSNSCDSTPKGFHIADSLYLPEGSYTITKRLSISKYGMDYYRDSIFMKRNTCKTFQDFYNEVSDSIRSQANCSEQSCDSCAAHTSSLATFRVYYLNSIGIPLSDSAKYRDDITLAYSQAKEECDFICGNIGQHTFIRMAMLTDMTAPTGQYANPDSAYASTRRFNIFAYDNLVWKTVTYHDEYGKLDSLINENGVLVPVNQLSQVQFIASFKDSWARDLLPRHPEYPKLVKYEEHISSHIWDEKFNAVETFADANSKGYLNPVSLPSYMRPSQLTYNFSNLDPLAKNDSMVSSMQQKVYSFVPNDNLSLWGVASISGKCVDNNGCASRFTNSHLDSCLHTSIFCTGELDMAWRSFKQIYQTTKRAKVMDSLNRQYQYIHYLIPPYRNEHFAVSAALLDNYTSSVNGQSASGVINIMNGHIQQSYQANCEQLAASWWMRLAPCFFGVNNTDSLKADSLRLIPRMVQICVAGSDANHNFGSSSTAPGSTLKYKSFEELVRFYIDSMHAIYPTVYNYNYSCNADLINTPEPYDQQTSLSNISIWTKPDSCQCSTISNYYAKYKQYGNSDSSFAAYILRKTGTAILDADLTKLLNMCSGIDTCKFLVTPITLPPALQCGIKDVCVSCQQVRDAFTIFKSKYPGVYPSYNEDDSVQIIRNTAFANCMNNRLGFTKTALEYLEFMDQCGTKYIADSSRCDSLNNLLANFRDFYSSINFKQVYKTNIITKCAQDILDASNAMFAKLHNTPTSTVYGDKGYAAAPYSKNFDVRLKSVTPSILGAYPFYPTTSFNNSIVPLTLGCTIANAETSPRYNYLKENILYPHEFIQPLSPANELGHKPVFAVAMEDHDKYFKMIFGGTPSYYNHSNPAFDYETYQAPTPLYKYIYHTSLDTVFPAEAHIHSLTFIDASGISTPGQYDTYYDNYFATHADTLYSDGYAYIYVTGIPHSEIKKVYNLRFDDNILSQIVGNPISQYPKYLKVTLDYMDGHTGDAYIALGLQRFVVNYTEPIDTNLYNPDCQKSFTTYYNSHQTPPTSYTYAQIDSIFLHSCGASPLPCAFIPPNCDTLSRVTEEYNTSLLNIERDSTDSAELDVFDLFQPYYPPQSDLDNYKVSDYINNGTTARMPDSLRYLPGASVLHYGIQNKLTMCSGPDITFEYRVKVDTGQQNTAERNGWGPTEFTSVISFNNDAAQYGIVMNSTDSTYAGFNNPWLAWGKSSFVQRLDEWAIIRIVISGTTVSAYKDNVLMGKMSFPGLPPRTKITRYHFGMRNASYYVDWVKIYDAAGVLKYEETFNDIKNFAKPPADWICTSICDTSFTTFFNNRFGTSLNNTQVQKLYQDCGREGADCDHNQLLLCGKNEPLFTDIEFTEADPCADTSSLSFVRATELYRAYLDSLNNAFDSSYLAKCKKAFKTESFTVTHPVSEYHYTLYYYDQSGNLVKTVPPSAVDLSGKDRTTWFDSVAVARKNGTYLAPSHGLVTNYRYNTLNQVTAQVTPDAGKSNFYYDRLGRLVVSQNAKQHAASASEIGRQYSYTKYDPLGRIMEVGQLTNTVDTAVTQNITQSEGWLPLWLTHATNSYVSIEQVTRTYYDNKYAASVGIPVLYPKNLRNRVAYTTYTGGNSTALYSQATFYSYDIHGNVDTLLQDYGRSDGTANIMNSNDNRWKRMVYQYDLISGKVNNVAYQPQYIEGGILKIPQDAFYHRYNYDAENRITSVETSADSTVWEKDARYDYYKHGAVARTVLGQLQVQGLDYAYTLQGWFKGVNATTLAIGNDMGNDGDPSNANTKNIARDAIAFNLNYFNGDYVTINGNNPFANVSAATFNTASNYRPLFNGNISSMAVNIRRFNSASGTAGDSAMLYNYKYDQLNRLKGRDAYRGLNTGSNAWGTTMMPIDQYQEKLTYDANGNILTYLKNGNLGGSNVSMDNLQYSYIANTNQLSRVTDAVTSSRYATDIDDQPVNNYAYDAIGNLIKDSSENIASINWNVYGKIASINKRDPGGSGSRIKQVQYTYDAAGQRISKRVSKYNTTTVDYTWYVKDASGNAMSIYSYNGDSSVASPLSVQTLYQKEINLYGSSRLGSLKVNRNTEAVSQLEDSAYHSTVLADSIRGKFFTRGNKQYELNNHLGNVLATISDKKIPYSSGGTTVDYYNAEFTNAFDYYSYGMIMPGRQYYIDSTVSAILSGGQPLGNPSTVQVYRHGFEGTPYNKPYTVAPAYADAHLSTSSWTNNRTSEIGWTTYNSFSNSTALGLPGNADTSNTITFSIKVDSGYAMTVKSFSFYDRSSSTGYKNWSIKINGITAGADTTYVDNPGGNHVPRPTGTVSVANPVKNLTGTVSFVITLNNKGSGSTGTFKIDSFIVNGFVIPLSDTGYNSSLYVHNGYRYRVNTQEYSPELNDNSYTAEFWQYDARLGRRWNVDPVVKEPESPFATFGANPIWRSDIKGDDWVGKDNGNGTYTPYYDKNVTKSTKLGKGYIYIGPDAVVPATDGKVYLLNSNGTASLFIAPRVSKTKPVAEKGKGFIIPKGAGIVPDAFNYSKDDVKTWNDATALYDGRKARGEKLIQGGESDYYLNHQSFLENCYKANQEYRTVQLWVAGGFLAPYAIAEIGVAGVAETGSWIVNNYGRKFVTNLGINFLQNGCNIKKVDWFDVSMNTVNPFQKFGFQGQIATQLVNANFDLKINSGAQSFLFGNKSGTDAGIDLMFGTFGTGYKGTANIFRGENVARDYLFDVLNGNLKGTVKQTLKNVGF